MTTARPSPRVRASRGVSTMRTILLAILAAVILTVATPCRADTAKVKVLIIAGGTRPQSHQGKMNGFIITVGTKHPITEGITEFKHGRDELYQNSVMLHDSQVLATAWSDKKTDPKNTDKDEPMLWVATYGKG